MEFNVSIIIIFAVLGTLGFAACLCVCYSCYFHINIRLGQVRDQMNNDMLIEELEESQKEAVWCCTICDYENSSSRDECIMCWSKRVHIEEPRSDADNVGSLGPRIISAEHTISSTPFAHKARHGDTTTSLLRSISSHDLVLQAGVLPGKLERVLSTERDQSGLVPMDVEQRQRALHARRANDLMTLNQRQKGARRRRLWKRQLGADGTMRWVRTDITEEQQRLFDSNLERLALSNPDASLHPENDDHQHPMDIEIPIKRTDSNLMSLQSLHKQSKVSIGFVSAKDHDGVLSWFPAGLGPVSEMASGQHQFNPRLIDNDLEGIAAMPFKEKHVWFLKQLRKIVRPAKQGICELVVHRDKLLQDSADQLLSIPLDRLKERLRITFVGEAGLDAGGLLREWSTVVSEKLFSNECGLFRTTEGQDLSYWINPKAPYLRQDWLALYEFAGRFLGKMILEEQLFPAHLALPLLKHLLGVPISFSDLEFLDKDIYSSAVQVHSTADVDSLYLDFTIMQEQEPGKIVAVNLLPDGNFQEVTEENKSEYLYLVLRYYMLDSIAPQLASFMTGLYDVVPKALLSVFDYQELELLLNGLPEIDVEDWEQHTDYQFKRVSNRPSRDEKAVVKWFWTVVREFSMEKRAKFLQFVTGTSRVPVQGFKGLLSSDGHVRRFTIRTVDIDMGSSSRMYPRAHTCFNRLDLPVYTSLADLRTYLSLVINMEIIGFGLV